MTESWRNAKKNESAWRGQGGVGGARKDAKGRGQFGSGVHMFGMTSRDEAPLCGISMRALGGSRGGPSVYIRSGGKEQCELVWVGGRMDEAVDRRGEGSWMKLVLAGRGSCSR